MKCILMFETHTLGDHKRDLLVIKAIHVAGVFTLEQKEGSSQRNTFKCPVHWPDSPVHSPRSHLLPSLSCISVCLCFSNLQDPTTGFMVAIKVGNRSIMQPTVGTKPIPLNSGFHNSTLS